MDSESIKREMAERFRAICDLDMDWGRKLAAEHSRRPGHVPSDEVVLMSLHKARVSLPAAPVLLRVQSMSWLKARGYKPLDRRNWPRDGSLP